jgi:tetratricopeptide (TPR) repeat protein
MAQKQMLASFLAVLLMAAGSVSCNRSPEEREAKFLKRGQSFLEHRDYSRAILEFRNAANLAPRDPEPYYQIGVAYLSTRTYDTAVAAFQKALSLNPKHPGAQLKLAGLMTTSFDTKVLGDAQKRLQELVANSPDNTEAIDTLAMTEWKLGRPEEAAKMLDQALMKSPSDIASSIVLARIKLSQNDPDGAEQVLKKWVAGAPKSPEAALALGRFYMQLHKPTQAEPEFRRALAVHPDYAPALFSLALLQVEGNRQGEAEQTLKQLAYLSANDYQHLYGLFLFQHEKREQALAEFQRLAKANSDDRQARTRLITAYVLMDRVREADRVLAGALKHNPKDTEALLEHSELRLRTGDFATAEKDLNQVISYQSDSAQAHFQLARVKKMQGWAAGERQELAQALEGDKNFLAARLALARSLNVAKEYKSALALVHQAPVQQKMSLDLHTERNWALLGLGQTKEAREGIEQGLRVSKTPELLVQDGYLRMQEKDYARAAGDANEALTLDPENVPAYRMLVESYGAQKLERLIGIVHGLEVWLTTYSW